MDNEIKKENKIQTGCDQFTKPEEISALSKYLKKNRELLESNTELGEDNLEVYGRKYGSLKEVESLSNEVETIKDNHGISKLGSRVEMVGEDKTVEKLENTREDIKVGDDPTLETLIKNLENNVPLVDTLAMNPAEKLGNLSKDELVLENNIGKVVGKIDTVDNIAQESAGKIANVIGDEELSTELSKIGIEEEKISGLESGSMAVLGETGGDIGLRSNNNTIPGTTDKISELETTETAILGNTEQITELGSNKETINVNDSTSLTNTIIPVENEIIDSNLYNSRELVGNTIPSNELSGSEERVSGEIEDTSLSNNTESLKINNTVDKLREDIETISGEHKESGELSGNIEKIGNKPGDNENLGTDIKNIAGELKDKDLESLLSNIENEDTIIDTKKLGKNISKINGVKESNKLSSVIIPENKDNTKPITKLETGNEKIERTAPDIKTLGKNISKISGVKDKDLESTATDNIEPGDNIETDSLDKTTALKLGSIKDIDLSKDIIKKSEGEKDNNLSSKSIKLGIKNKDIELDSAVVKNNKSVEESKKLESGTTKIGGKVEETKKLSTSVDLVKNKKDVNKLEQETTKIGNIKPVSELGKSISEVEDKKNNKDQDLSDKVIKNKEESKWNGGLSKNRDKVTHNSTISDKSLSDKRLKTEKDDTTKIGSEGKADHEQFENISDGGLYDTILGIIENDKFSFEPGDDPNKSKALDTTIKNVLEAEHPSTDPDYIGSEYDPSSDKLGTGRNQYKESYKRPGDDTSKINYGKNYKRDKEDDPERDDYIHTGWEGKLSGSYDKVDSNDSLSDKTLSDVLIERLDNEGIGEVSELSSKKIDTEKDDTSKINYGKNYKRDKEDDPERDDYNHTGWNETLSKSYDKVDHNSEIKDEPLSNKIIGANKDDTSKINYGKNYKRDSEDDPGRDDYIHTGWKENLSKSYEKVDWDSGKGDIKKSVNNEDSLISDVTSKKSSSKKLSKDGIGKDYIGELSKEDAELRDVLLSKQGGLDNYYENLLRFASSKNLSISDGWKEKIKSLISSYLSSDSINSTKAEEFEKQIFNTIIGDQGNVQLKRYQLSVSWSNAINANKYIRWLAEKSVNWIPGKSTSWILGHKPSGGSIREAALDLVLMTLVSARRVAEVLTKSNRDRLPGSDTGLLQDIVQGQDTKTLAKKALSGLITSIAKSGSSVANVDKERPLNRPYKYTETTGWQYGNNRLSPSINESKERSSAPNDVVGGNSKTNFLGSILKTLKAASGEALLGNTSATPYSFNKNYLSSWGMATTLQDLCGVVPANIDSVENLNIALKNSMYSTTVEKFSTSRDNVSTGKTTTLDDNSFWEIVFDPFVGKDNGNYSYLPSIDEINVWNMLHFGITTGYNRWIPFTSFDLSKNKVTTKSLSLFDGEINYPTSMEFTNELRLTIADDQYKSWRTYFERCSDASIYSSEPHKSSYYGYSEGYYTPTNVAGLTAIDKTFVCPALYKNITFRCIIFSLTPQLETISKYDLLVVLKDMAEERSGDIDPGGGDLTLTFSIVGENPNEFKYISNADVANAQYEASLKKAKAKETGKLLKSVAQGAGSQALSIIGI